MIALVLFSQKTRAPIYSVDMYIDNLHQCCDGKKNRLLSSSGHSNLSNGNSNGSNICSTNPTANLEVSHLLQKLRLDLKMSYQWWGDSNCETKYNKPKCINHFGTITWYRLFDDDLFNGTCFIFLKCTLTSTYPISRCDTARFGHIFL